LVFVDLIRSVDFVCWILESTRLICRQELDILGIDVVTFGFSILKKLNLVTLWYAYILTTFPSLGNRSDNTSHLRGSPGDGEGRLCEKDAKAQSLTSDVMADFNRDFGLRACTAQSSKKHEVQRIRRNKNEERSIQTSWLSEVSL
jgi:hypothetical protein